MVKECGVYSFQTDGAEEYFPPKAALLILGRLCGKEGENRFK